MKISISDNGSVEFIESNGVTWDQLAAHKEVKVGRQYEAKPFYEALSYLKREDSEAIKGFYPGMFKKVYQTAFLVQLNFQSIWKENIKLRHS